MAAAALIFALLLGQAQAASSGCRGDACSSGNAWLQLHGSFNKATTSESTFQPVDGGMGRACRGTSAGDNQPSYYQVMPAGSGSLDACKDECLADARCKGIEYSPGRCEVWTRTEGIQASIPLDGFSCYSYGEPETTLPPRAGQWEAVDGATNRACRGASGGDNSADHYSIVRGLFTLSDCQAECTRQPACQGVEFSPNRCEIWTRAEGIQASAPVSGYSCYRFLDPSMSTTTPYPPGSFEAVNGGKDQACRGASASDNRPSYFDVIHGVSSITACKAECMKEASCTGIEYSPGRCEIWTRAAGIEASITLSGFNCWRRTEEPGVRSCTASNGEGGATDAICAETCSYLDAEQWPCGGGGPCLCSGGATILPTAAPTTTMRSTTAAATTATMSTTSSTTIRATTSARTTTAAGTTLSTPSTTLDRSIQALESSNSDGVFMYDTGSGWLPSDIYTWPDMIQAVRLMATSGVGSLKLWLGDTNHVYGLVNVAAFLAQCMQETIQYNACDENNWSDKAVVQEAGGATYSAASACGQLHQSYQDYSCSPEEDALAGGKMACDVDPNMEMRAYTQAGWYGAPAKLFCAPKSKVPKAPRWDYSAPWCAPEDGWGHVPPFADDVPLDEYFDYVNGGGSCKDYQGIKTGGWKFTGEGCVDGACPNPDAPLFGQPEGREDLEGCCWWGRGVIQTTGTCNFGKLNFFMGKRAADEGRSSIYPQIDFCKNPNSICDPSSPPELKWVAGMFYWLNAVQPYSSGGWDYIAELKKWVDNGMQKGDRSFINGASGIVNRGCHNPPNCGTGELHAATERAANFDKVLEAMGL